MSQRVSVFFSDAHDQLIRHWQLQKLSKRPWYFKNGHCNCKVTYYKITQDVILVSDELHYCICLWVSAKSNTISVIHLWKNNNRWSVFTSLLQLSHLSNSYNLPLHLCGDKCVCRSICTCPPALVCVCVCVYGFIRLSLWCVRHLVLFQCHSILLGEYITSPGCHHVYACLYMSSSLRSIFGRGQLLSSAALPEGPTPTVLP